MLFFSLSKRCQHLQSFLDKVRGLVREQCLVRWTIKGEEDAIFCVLKDGIFFRLFCPTNLAHLSSVVDPNTFCSDLDLRHAM
jgi:hypothetical protein